MVHLAGEDLLQNLSDEITFYFANSFEALSSKIETHQYTDSQIAVAVFSQIYEIGFAKEAQNFFTIIYLVCTKRQGAQSPSLSLSRNCTLTGRSLVIYLNSLFKGLKYLTRGTFFDCFPTRSSRDFLSHSSFKTRK